MHDHDGKKFQEIIEDSTFTIQDWAEEIGVTRRTIYNWIGAKKLNRSIWAKINTVFGREPEPRNDDKDIFETHVNYKRRYFIEVAENDMLKQEIKQLKDELEQNKLMLSSYKKAMSVNK
jgi:plasmid maintenance system antidote protein VapI